MTNSNVFEVIHVLLTQGHLEEALRILYNSRNDTIKPPYDHDLNHAWYVVGDIYFRNKDFKRAVHAFKHSLDAWQEDSDAYLAIGNCYDELCEYTAAEDHFRKALEINPKCERSMFNLGNMLFDQEKYQEAIECYKEVVNSDTVVGKRSYKNIKLAKSRLKNLKKKSY